MLADPSRKYRAFPSPQVPVALPDRPNWSNLA
jgi:hypothetical protein